MATMLQLIFGYHVRTTGAVTLQVKTDTTRQGSTDKRGGYWILTEQKSQWVSQKGTKSCIRSLRVLLGKLSWHRTCKQKTLGGGTTSWLPLLSSLASVSYFAVGKRQHWESRHQLLSEQATNHLSHFLSAMLQVTLSLQAYWQKKQSNHPSSWHYQTYVMCTQAGNAALASQQQSWAEGFPNTSGAGKLCLFLPIN